MDLANQMLLYLLLIAGAQGVALATIVLSQKPRRLPFIFLGMFFLLMSLGCLEKSVEGIFMSTQGTELPLPLSHPLSYYPAIYLHLLFLAHPAKRFRAKHLLHFAPAFILDFASFYYIDWSGNPSSLGILSSGKAIWLFESFYTLCFLLNIVYYATAIHHLHLRLAEPARATAPSLLAWISRIKPVLLILWVSWLLVRIIGKGNPLGYFASFIIHGSAILSIYSFGYEFILKKRAQFAKQLDRPLNPNEPRAVAIIASIERSELHRNQKITLAEAARQLGYDAKSISQAVNSLQNANFNDFINRLRVEDFKSRAAMPESKSLSLFGIAQEVGFASKASFHRAFKKHSGQTPGEFMAGIT